jgi:hypothetical protein
MLFRGLVGALVLCVGAAGCSSSTDADDDSANCKPTLIEAVIANQAACVETMVAVQAAATDD